MKPFPSMAVTAIRAAVVTSIMSDIIGSVLINTIMYQREKLSKKLEVIDNLCAFFIVGSH